MEKLVGVFSCTRGDRLTYLMGGERVGRLRGPNITVLRAAAACYIQVNNQSAKGVNHDTKHLALRPQGHGGEVHDAIRLDRLVVESGSTHGVQARCWSRSRTWSTS